MSSARVVLGAIVSVMLAICSQAAPKSQPMPLNSMNESLGASSPEAANTLDTLDEVANEAPAVMRQKCFAALGHEGFCACIARESMAGTSFESYYRYNFLSRRQLFYDRASRTKKNAIDGAIRARRACAQQYFGKRG